MFKLKQNKNLGKLGAWFPVRTSTAFYANMKTIMFNQDNKNMWFVKDGMTSYKSQNTVFSASEADSHTIRSLTPDTDSSIHLDPSTNQR